MTPRLRRLWRRLSEQLWFKPAWWGLLASAVALAASLANQVLPDERVPDIERETLQSLLTIVASSMLTVSTFSLSILVQAFSSAAGNATPRALRVVMADDSAQTAVAAFLAAFIYSVIALLALGVGYYGAAGRFVLLLCTVFVMLNIIVMLVRWIRTLSKLGRVGDTIERVERAALASLREHRRRPGLGGHSSPPDSAHAGGGTPLRSASTGYVQHVDMQALEDTLNDAGEAVLALCVRPGGFVHRGQALGTVRGLVDPAALERLGAAITVAPERSFDQDPRFGLIVLSEIGQRALSPAINDPGTAIILAGAVTRTLIDTWPGADATDPAPECWRVLVPTVDEADFVRDAFGPLQRDAAGNAEVHTRLLKLLGAIADATGGTLAEAARRQAWNGWLHAREHVVLSHERAALSALARQVAGSGG